MKYLWILSVLFPSMLTAADDPCATQQDHCQTSEIFWRIYDIEDAVIIKDGYPWSVFTPIGGKHYEGDNQ